jgi:hypothetical protein
MPCGWPAPGRPMGHPGSGRLQGVIGVFNLISISNIIVPLIVEFTCAGSAGGAGGAGGAGVSESSPVGVAASSLARRRGLPSGLR